MPRILTACLALVSLSSSFIVPSYAGPTTFASAGMLVGDACLLNPSQCTVDDSSPSATATFDFSAPSALGPGIVSTADFAAASSSGVRASAGVGASALYQSGGTEDFMNGVALAQATYLVTVSGPDGTIPLSLNLLLDGTYDAFVNTETNPNAVGVAISELNVTATIAGVPSRGTFEEDVNGGSTTFSRSGLLTNFGTGEPLATPNLSLNIFGGSEVFAVTLQLEAGASLQDGISDPFDPRNDVVVSALSDFSHTLTFPSVGPVFNVPAGYTVDSSDALIVDNSFTGGAAAAVPEPATLTLTALGLAGLIVSRYRRRRSGSGS